MSFIRISILSGFILFLISPHCVTGSSDTNATSAGNVSLPEYSVNEVDNNGEGRRVKIRRENVSPEDPTLHLRSFHPTGAKFHLFQRDKKADHRRHGKSRRKNALVVGVGAALQATSTALRTGDATYYATGLGACGITSSDSSMIAAASHLLFDTFPGASGNPNENPICGRKLQANYNGKTVVVQIVDRCVGCQIYDLDFSPAAFKHLGREAEGRLHGMTWHWI